MQNNKINNQKYTDKYQDRYNKRENRDISAKSISDKFNQNSQENSSFSDLVQIEQTHRHSMNHKELMSYNINVRIGQFFALIYNLSILYLVAKLIKDNQNDLALKIFAINGFVLVIIAFFVVFEKQFYSSSKKNKKFKKVKSKSKQNKE